MWKPPASWTYPVALLMVKASHKHTWNMFEYAALRILQHVKQWRKQLPGEMDIDMWFASHWFGLQEDLTVLKAMSPYQYVLPDFLSSQITAAKVHLWCCHMCYLQAACLIWWCFVFLKAANICGKKRWNMLQLQQQTLEVWRVSFRSIQNESKWYVRYSTFCCFLFFEYVFSPLINFPSSHIFL